MKAGTGQAWRGAGQDGHRSASPHLCVTSGGSPLPAAPALLPINCPVTYGKVWLAKGQRLSWLFLASSDVGLEADL